MCMTAVIRQMTDAQDCQSRSGLPVYHRPMAHPQIPSDITRVTEAELRADLTTFLDCVAYAEDELVVMGDGQPIAAVISMEGWRALRRVAEGVVEQLGEERLRVLLGE